MYNQVYYLASLVSCYLRGRIYVYCNVEGIN